MLRGAIRLWSPVRHTIGSILADVENSIKDRIPAKDIVKNLSSMRSLVIEPPGTQSENIQLAFTCARLSKLGKLNTRETEILKNIAEGAVLQVDLSLADIKTLSRFLWACAVLNVKPLLPEAFMNSEGLSHAANKEYCNIVWALSKFASERDPVILTEFEQIINRLDESRAAELSNDDLVALLRSISIVYSR